jgi:hypothetical protein
MFVNKIGAQHLELGKNCQDYGVENEIIKLVCDGCSEGEHSEVGAKAFCHLADEGFDIPNSFKLLTRLFAQSDAVIKDFLCFTILRVKQTEENFYVDYCGDGYVILEDLNGDITFERLNDGEYPKYYAYNYCNPNNLKFYKDGVPILRLEYSKKQYKNVGVASDGLRFIVENDDSALRDEFINLLRDGKSVKVKRFINRNQKIFKDDITIVF